MSSLSIQPARPAAATERWTASRTTDSPLMVPTAGRSDSLHFNEDIDAKLQTSVSLSSDLPGGLCPEQSLGGVGERGRHEPVHARLALPFVRRRGSADEFRRRDRRPRQRRLRSIQYP